MGSIGNPKTWVPYMNSRDCSQGFCSLYCPQWCYIIFPPPPPLEFPEDDSSPSFSPLTISIIGILGSVFLLVSYYAIISKYCGTVDSSRRRRESRQQSEETEDNHDPSLHEPWQTRTTGLDEALINSIKVCKYKKGDGLIGETDCSVCLSEFEEDESLRLLPKCGHAFHVHCIDTWLKSHSNCPLCRANLIFVTASPLQLPPPATETRPLNESSGHSGNAAADTERGPEVAGVPQNEANIETPKSPFRGFSDSRNFQARDTIIEIRDEGYQQMRRSVSMDHCRLSISDILRTTQVEDGGVGGAGPSKQSSEAGKSSNRKRIKRSFSSGRFFITRQGRLNRDTMIPL